MRRDDWRYWPYKPEEKLLDASACNLVCPQFPLLAKSRQKFAYAGKSGIIYTRDEEEKSSRYIRRIRRRNSFLCFSKEPLQVVAVLFRFVGDSRILNAKQTNNKKKRGIKVYGQKKRRYFY